jgi:hypothetical protein
MQECADVIILIFRITDFALNVLLHLGPYLTLHISSFSEMRLIK